MRVLKLPFKALMVLTLMRPSLVLFLVLWLMLVKNLPFKALMLLTLFFFSSRRRHTRFDCDWSSDVCSSDYRSRQGDSHDHVHHQTEEDRCPVVGARRPGRARQRAPHAGTNG